MRSVQFLVGVKPTVRAMRTSEHILVIDVEATCWEGAPPPGQQSEIIEIGVCVLDRETGVRVERESVLVRPERSRVSVFCTQLTTLTQEQVDRGISFREACEVLTNRFASRERVWASYGEYDRKQFLAQCASWYVDYPFGPHHINVKSNFARLQGLRRKVGLAGALRVLGVPLEGIHHRGGDDAWNIALLLAHLLKTHTVSELISRAEDPAAAADAEVP